MLVVAISCPPERLRVPVVVLATMMLAAVPETPVPSSTVRPLSMIAVPLVVGTAPLDQLPPTFQVPEVTFHVMTSPHAGRTTVPSVNSQSIATVLPPAVSTFRCVRIMNVFSGAIPTVRRVPRLLRGRHGYLDNGRNPVSRPYARHAAPSSCEIRTTSDPKTLESFGTMRCRKQDVEA